MDVIQNALGTRFGIEEIEAVTRAMQSGHTSGLTSDGEGANFAKEFAEYCGVEFALPLNGACNALSIAARLVDLQPGDEIISNPITYIATAIYALRHEATVRFTETDSETLNADEDSIESLITPNTKALFIASYEGHVPDMARLRDICDRHHLFFVFDAARCCGGRFQDKSIAQFADATAFSFQEQKNMATGDGGMLVLGPKAPEAWRRKATQLRNVRGTGDVIGENFRMDEIRAAIGRTQLPKLDRMNDERRSLACRLTESLSAFPAIRPVKTFPDRRHVFHWYMATVDPDALNTNLDIFKQPIDDNDRPSPRDVFANEMKKEGIDMPSQNAPVYLTEPYPSRGYPSGLCPVSEGLWRNQITRFPLNLDMTDSEIGQIVSAVGRVLSRLS
jgi:perosamine synthetase